MISEGPAVDSFAELVVVPVNRNLVSHQSLQSVIMPLDNQPFDPEVGQHFLIIQVLLILILAVN